MSSIETQRQRVLHEVIEGRRALAALCGGRPIAAETPPQVIFPGAFNPLHAGHRQMAEVARDRCLAAPAFEISAVNVDKPPLAADVLLRRVEQFDPQHVVIITRAATFVDKARVFPAATFVVGIDTVLRIADPRYYNGPSSRDAAISGLAHGGCRFLVFGRVHAGRFRTLEQITLPPPLAELCQGVPETEFRFDIASRELR